MPRSSVHRTLATSGLSTRELDHVKRVVNRTLAAEADEARWAANGYAASESDEDDNSQRPTIGHHQPSEAARGVATAAAARVVATAAAERTAAAGPRRRVL